MAVDASQLVRASSIVLIGAFNPLILEPRWLADNAVISEYELEDVQERGRYVAAADLIAMELRSFSLQCERDRLQLSTTQETETPSMLGDVLLNLFSLLPHTPISSMGFNHMTHQPMDDGRVHTIIDTLATPGPLGGSMVEPRLVSLTWAGERPDARQGHQRFTVEPSVRVRGLFASLNDHYELGDQGSGTTASDVVADRWQESIKQGLDVFDDLLRLA